jgi:predicted Zn-dependent protease
MNREQCEKLTADILAIPHPPGELQVTLHGVERLGTRFNDCAISQNTLQRQHMLTLGARLGQKQTSLSINRIDDRERIRQSVEQVFANCRHMPDDEESMPAPGNRLDSREHAYSAETEALDIDGMGRWVGAACREGAAAGIDLAGLLSVKKEFAAYADSTGGFACERSQLCDYHVTASGRNGSGWAEHQGVKVSEDEVMAATRRAIDKCQKAQDPQVFEPRPVTVILEPQAVGDLLSIAFWYGFDQRAADEGRSAFSEFDGALGRLTLYSDPASALFPTVAFNIGGEALEKAIWLDQGRLQQLVTSRYWASKKKLAAKPSPANLILEGAGTTLENLIRGTADGILVTRFWYIRPTDPKTLGFTGMTRDGTYRIENGIITHPVVDMRWNDSVLRLLNSVADSGTTHATGEFLPMAMPPLKVEAFNFTSLSN